MMIFYFIYMLKIHARFASDTSVVLNTFVLVCFHRIYTILINKHLFL